jgi:hypothetical protein
MNIWAQLKALLPDQPLLIGTVTEIDETAGTSAVTLLGGGTLYVRGTRVAIGQKAFIRAGVIEDAAPDLEEVLIEI